MKNIIGLKLEHLTATVENKEILHDISLEIKPGEVHAVMGPNGSGKSTLAYALMGHPLYKIQNPKSKIRNITQLILNGINLMNLSTEMRAKAGLFLAMQSPVAIPGVSVIQLLREGYQEIHSAIVPKNSLKSENPALMRRLNVADLSITEFMALIQSSAKKLSVNESLLIRGIHDGFSGGERKKVEMLEALILRPKYAIFDEIDTGLDVDALKTVASGIDLLKKQNAGIIIITHYQRILKYLKPDYVHILANGKIVDTGKSDLAKIIEVNGYQKYLI
jgi:Fe-S cluster assembly ATP-binding protein